MEFGVGVSILVGGVEKGCIVVHRSYIVDRRLRGGYSMSGIPTAIPRAGDGCTGLAHLWGR